MAPSRGRRPPAAASTKQPSQDLAAAAAANAQPLLDVFRTAFADRLDPNGIEASFNPLLQEVKGHLYRRDFATAFGRPEYLQVYACRWSAARAIGYMEIFAHVWRHLSKQTNDQTEFLSVASLGGGAGAEMVALLALREDINISCVDSADWSSIVSQLTQASAQRREARGSVSFHKRNLLSDEQVDQATLNSLFQSSSLITLMFTLNELYSTSISATQRLLLSLTSHTSAGTVLLVVDSPGSYSTVMVGGKEKQYPMAWLLDYTLLKLASEVDTPKSIVTKGRLSPEVKAQSLAEPPWEKIESDLSRWFRLPDGLRFPLTLENMRYQIHVYRRT